MEMNSSPSLPARGKRVLIYFFGIRPLIGGGDFLPLFLMSELQKRGYSITLALCNDSDLEWAKKIWHIELDTQKIKASTIAPKVNSFLWRLDRNRPFYRTWKLKKMAKDADLLISVSNTMDFGRPAHHILCDIRSFRDRSFRDYVEHVAPLKGFALRKRKIRTFFAETLIGPLLGYRSTRKIFADPREHIYPNSQYVNTVLHEFYGPFTGTVFYPPSVFETSLKDVKRNPLQINYIGRIYQGKGLDDIISIVESARNSTGLDLTLMLAGGKEASSYANSIEQRYKEKKWVRFIGQVQGEAKERFLLSGTYAVHAVRDEAFGLSITEYLKAGCIPIVPDEGGPAEIVDSPALTYHTNEEAASILAKLLHDEDFRKEQLAHCRERAKSKIFSLDFYLEQQRQLLDRILSETEQ